MLKRLLNVMSNKNPKKVITQHGINPNDISANATKVLNKLHQAGFASYLVGGGVRDLLLNLAPKDFDVATDATPEEIRRLFKNSQIIGRRFKIVHVRYGRDIIEVTTFRGTAAEGNQQQVASDEGQLLRDNVYGDLKSDALRRDFTVNALYYNLQENSIVDFTNGIDDLEKRQLTIIGDPVTRYKEDPVRLLRAVRFSAKLDFTIEESTRKPIKECASLLLNVPAARLFDEFLKLMLAGHATATFAALNQHGLFDHLFPQTVDCLNADPRYPLMIDEVMRNTDIRIRTGKRVTPAFILAVLLWPPMIELRRTLLDKGFDTQSAFHEAANTVIKQQVSRITIPKRFSIPMRQIWELQWRLPMRRGKRAYSVFEHPKFRAGYDFVLVREAAGEPLDGLGQWWTDFQEQDAEGRTDMTKALSGHTKPRTKDTD